jgi:ureidoglycolate dehydrogenase (NAD+)
MESVNTRAGNATTRHVPSAQLLLFAENVLVAAGVPREDAHIVADCLTFANLSGVDTHGIVRLAHYVRRLENGSIKTRPQIVFKRLGPAVGVMDGGDGLGHVVTHRACTEAMRLAEEAGSGTVTIKNSSHFGMTGFYVNRLVAAGYAAIMMTDTDQMLIPFGGRKPFFGTNPIAVGFPTDGIPLILDMATTSIPYGKVVLAQTEGKPIPPDWGFDEEGNPTTDANKLVGLHPIAGPKGSGLATIIDVFCSILTGMPFGPHINRMYVDIDQPRELGHFVMALDVKRFMPLDVFKQRLSAMTGELNAMSPAEGFARVYYPGQVEGEKRLQRAAEGVPIDPGLYQELEGLGQRFNLPFGDGRR